MMKSFLWWLIFIGILVKLAFFIVSQKDYFLRKFDPEYFGKLYSDSQYVKGQLSKGGIGDDGLYAFAGYYYLFQKGDISSVNFEHPPVGKYLIGLSIFLFRNENVINIIYFILLLILTYKIGKLILKDNLLSLVGVVILSFDQLFLDNLLRSLLDLPFTLFFVAAVYSFLKGLAKPKYLYLSMFFWGMTFSTRFFPSLVILYGYLLLVIFFYRRKGLPIFFATSFLIPIIYLVSHVSFFFYHPSLLEFLRHKKWMLSWFTGSPVIIGNFWRNVFTGTYIDPTGKISFNPFWSPIMPAILVLALGRWRKTLLKRENMNILTIYGLSFIYLLYVAIFTYGVQKFLMPVYPLLIILALSNISQLYSIIKVWKKRILPR